MEEQNITCITRDKINKRKQAMARTGYWQVGTPKMEKHRERIEELLKFTLESHINQTLEFNVRLSKDFCINLLEEYPNDMLCHSTPTPTPTPTDSFDGVALYPLYKRLASALYRSVKSGAVCRTYEKMVFGDKDSNLKQKEENWDQLIKEKGLELINVLEGISCEIHVQEPYFSLLKDGRKTIEGRCATGDYIRIEPGDLILVNKIVVLKVEDVRRYASFSKMLQAENLEKVLPGVKTVEEGVKIYRKFYTEEKEMSNGVLAICVSKLTAQPYLSLSSILFGLSYGGVRRLLGLADTGGTVSNALPPPRSTLLSSFISPYNPNVKLWFVMNCFMLYAISKGVLLALSGPFYIRNWIALNWSVQNLDSIKILVEKPHNSSHISIKMQTTTILVER
ncbi:hypothetical protein NC653_019599 [Populus alba x Populus x berolinensis]|uniref:ASCH domain-containing protein n=2 Tax=Populus alba x Populus x berolinensis TaxID=444605 RepID=A0AAD6QJE8_9ROSI|nr:hypothetical protein NC653_019599 [Populus alba x Populus x berolinensis]